MIQWLAAFAALTDEDCARPWTWRPEGEQLQVRDALYRSLEEEQEAAVGAVTHSEAQAILATAQSAFGDLRGLLAGLPDELLDRVPRPGEWSLRETLQHIEVVERSYRLRTRYAADRRESEPVVMPAQVVDEEIPGGFTDVLGRLERERAESDSLLASIPASAMTRPSRWMEHSVDVRFRLHRFAGHLAEHTVQCEKTLAWLGSVPTEARLIARRISAMRGRHEHVSDLAVLERLDDTHRSRAAALDVGR